MVRNDLKETILYKFVSFIPVPLQLQLIQYAGPSINTTNSVTTGDCKAWFPGPVELYEGNRCQCNDISFINEDSTGCRKYMIKIV